MSKLEKLEKFYKWLCAPCPVLVDITVGALSVMLTLTIITLVCSLVWWIFGWYLVPIILIALLVVSGVHLFFAHKDYDGGIKEWWDEKPW